jgi:hypothetical protein
MMEMSGWICEMSVMHIPATSDKQSNPQNEPAVFFQVSLGFFPIAWGKSCQDN